MRTLGRLAGLSVALLVIGTGGCSSDATDGSASVSAAQTGVSPADADAATQALVGRFWNGSTLNDADPATNGNCGRDACYWIFAEAFDAVLDAVQRTGGKSFAGWASRLYDAQNARGWVQPHAGKHYDDENWMALALIRGYDATGDAKYLCRAVTLYRDIKSEGFDRAGGAFAGIWWDAAHTQKATASNFGPAITAARLHERPAMDNCSDAQHGVVDAATLADDARVIYDHWLAAMTRGDGQGGRQVADHIAGDCPGGVCWWDFTYNQGLAIGAAVELQHITGDGAYLGQAHELAGYMIRHEVTAGGVLHDGGACAGDCAAFKGIGYRYLLKLYGLDTSQTQYGDVLRASAVAIWNAARNGHDTFSAEWTGPAPSSTTLAADASAVMALNLAVEHGTTGASSPPPPPPPPPPPSCGHLDAGATLGPGGSIASCDGRFRLAMQASDGNLVLYEGSAPRWATGTVGHAGDRLVMQGDGNLVLYAGGTPLWYTATDGHPGATLAVQTDGNVVVYAGGTPLWARFGMPTQSCYVRCCDGALPSVPTPSAASCRGEYALCNDHGHGRVKHMEWAGQSVYGPVSCP